MQYARYKIQDTRYQIQATQLTCAAQKCKCKCARNFFRRRWQVNNKTNYNNSRNYLIYNICSTNTFSIQYLFNGKHECQQHQHRQQRSKENVLKQKINAKFVVWLGMAWPEPPPPPPLPRPAAAACIWWMRVSVVVQLTPLLPRFCGKFCRLLLLL